MIGLFNGKGIHRDTDLNVVSEAEATATVRISGVARAVCVTASAPEPEIRAGRQATEVVIEPGGFVILRVPGTD